MSRKLEPLPCTSIAVMPMESGYVIENCGLPEHRSCCSSIKAMIALDLHIRVIQVSHYNTIEEGVVEHADSFTEAQVSIARLNV